MLYDILALFGFLVVLLYFLVVFVHNILINGCYHSYCK